MRQGDGAVEHRGTRVGVVCARQRNWVGRVSCYGGHVADELRHRAKEELATSRGAPAVGGNPYAIGIDGR